MVEAEKAPKDDGGIVVEGVEKEVANDEDPQNTVKGRQRKPAIDNVANRYRIQNARLQPSEPSRFPSRLASFQSRYLQHIQSKDHLIPGIHAEGSSIHMGGHQNPEDRSFPCPHLCYFQQNNVLFEGCHVSCLA